MLEVQVAEIHARTQQGAEGAVEVAGIKPAGQQILYGVIILMMLFIYGRARQIRE